MFIFLGMVLVSLAVMSLIRFDTPDAVSAKASDFNMPTVSNSDEIVVVFGTVKLESPNVINWGNFRSEKLTKKVKTGLFSSKRVTTGYKYYCTMDMALCLGDISIGKIEAATYTIAEGPGLTKSISVNLPSLFGQEGGEHQSGIVGTFSVYTGVDNPDYFFSDTKSIYKTVGQSAEEIYSPLYPIQDLPDETDFPTNSNRRPGNPGVARVVFDGYIGNTTFARPFKFTVTRQPTNVVSGIGIGKDANPAAVIYEILTSKVAGLGLSNDQIDITSLQEAADTLQAEELGISLKWSSDMEASKLIDVICEHINATYYNDNETGKFTLKLVRKADNYDDVPVFNQADILDVVSISRPDTSEIVTEVKVKYISREQEFKEAVAVANSKAAEDYAGRTISQTQTFHGISNARNAQLVAARRLSEYSASPATIEFRALSAKGINNGELAAIEYPLRGITKIVGRVIQIDHGTLEKPIKTIKLLEDIFTTTEGQFSDVPPVQWDGNSSNAIPAPITDYIYLRLNQLIADNPSLILISQPAENANSLTIEQVSDLGNDTVGTQDFYEYRQINTDIKRGTKTLTFAGQFFTATQASSADIKQASNLAVITDGTDYEWIALRTFVFDAETGITTWSYVERGLLDTPPKEWPANTTVYLLGELNVIEPDQSEGDPVLRAYSEGAYRRSDSYAEDTVADDGIHTRPLPPEIDINGKFYPSDISGDTELNVSLLPRNGETIALNQESQTLPIDTAYTRELYIDGELVDTGTEAEASWTLLDIYNLNNEVPFTQIEIRAWGSNASSSSLTPIAQINTWDDNGAQYNVVETVYNFSVTLPAVSLSASISDAVIVLDDETVPISQLAALSRNSDAVDQIKVMQGATPLDAKVYTNFEQKKAVIAVKIPTINPNESITLDVSFDSGGTPVNPFTGIYQFAFHHYITEDMVTGATPSVTGDPSIDGYFSDDCLSYSITDTRDQTGYVMTARAQKTATVQGASLTYAWGAGDSRRTAISTDNGNEYGGWDASYGWLYEAGGVNWPNNSTEVQQIMDDGSNRKLYIDGVYNNSDSGGRAATTTFNQVFVGASYEGSTHFSGYIYEARIASHAKSDDWLLYEASMMDGTQITYVTQIPAGGSVELIEADPSGAGWTLDGMTVETTIKRNANTAEISAYWGTYMFMSGDATEHSAEKSFDVSAYSLDIDANSLVVFLRGAIACDYTDNDYGRFEVIFLDELGAEISTMYGNDLSPNSGQDNWTVEIVTGSIPALTRAIKLRMYSYKNSGTLCNPFFDINEFSIRNI